MGANFRQPPNAGAEAVIVSKNIAANGTYNASSDSADGYNPVTVNVPSKTIVSKSITANGTYNASGDSADGYDPVIVNVPTIEGVIIGTTDPTSEQGENGDYYYKRGPFVKNGVDGWTYQNSSSSAGGMSFTVPIETTITGIMVYNRGSATVTGNISIGTTTPIYSSGNIPISPGWFTHLFPSPITLLPGVTYNLIVDYSNSGYLIYTPLSSLSSNYINIVSGKYGSFPGTSDNTNAYGASIIISDPDTLYIYDQYKKINGVWTPITL